MTECVNDGSNRRQSQNYMQMTHTLGGEFLGLTDSLTHTNPFYDQ